MPKLSLETVAKIEQAIIDARQLGSVAVSKRTTIQEAKYQSALVLINQHLKDFFLDLNEQEFDYLQASNFHNLDEYAADLDSNRLKPPLLGQLNIDLLTIQKALKKMYEDQSTIQGYLEEIEPMMVRYEDIVKRAERIMKGLCLANTEWEGESLFAILFPRNLFKQYSKLREILAQIRARDRNYDKAFEKLSRYITTMQGDPGEMDRPRSVVSGGDKAHQDLNEQVETKAPVGKTPGWRLKMKEESNGE